MRFVLRTSPLRSDFLPALCAAALTGQILLAPTTVRAQSASESFSYTLGSGLSGQGSGTGFSGAWAPGGFNATVSANYTVGSGSLTFPGLITSGNSVTTTAQNALAGLTRGLTTSLGTPGTTAYLSFLMRPEGTLGQGAFDGFFGLYLNASTGNDLFIGRPGTGNPYVLETRGGGGQVQSNVTAVSGVSHLFVVRADFTAGNDLFTLYIDPTPGQAEPAAGFLKQDTNVGAITGLTLYSAGAFSLDEIRIGSTFASVTPAVTRTEAPEPGSLALLLPLIGLVDGVIRWRRN